MGGGCSSGGKGGSMWESDIALFEPPSPQSPARKGSANYPPPESGFLKDDGSCSPGGRSEVQGFNDAVSPMSPSNPEEENYDSSQGVVWHAKLMTDEFSNPKEFLPSGELKPRRPMPIIKVSEFLDGLQKIDGRWILQQPLNGWPSLQGLELRALTVIEGNTFLTRKIRRLWNAESGADLPAAASIPKKTRATFHAGAWTAVGWSRESPGFVWWYVPRAIPGGGGFGSEGCFFGERIVEALDFGPRASCTAVRVHAFAHRYPVESESVRDRQTWHTGVLIEWSHGEYTTLIELAWLNGISGYAGKSNWVPDKLESVTELYQGMSPSMVLPWKAKRSEIRVLDMPMSGIEEFKEFLHKYSEKGDLPKSQWRFLEPKVYASGPVRLRLCTLPQVAGYLLSYCKRASSYDTLSANCQTFAADLYAFLAGAKDHKPFGAIVRPAYQQRIYSFLYA
ncbi:unnamed protein product [Polarella glacialis]|uniref:PPPDE domain-containing protein n=1 Tax=Polarella glacialis TaxID=89957 RepID=A0A813FI63_POLGL|nr:unnamed protein product [Polarella glacialis]